MKIQSILANNSVKLLSGLANNDDSLAAMALKDWIGDSATVYTYKKNGGKDDAREKAIEEFGVGALWLFGIPLIKKAVEKTVYPCFKLNPDFDPRVLDNKDKLKTIKDVVSGEEKSLFSSLDTANPVLKSFTNAQLYKYFAAGKFLLATAISAFALGKIIKYKQKTTNDRIKKDSEQKASLKNTPLLEKKIQNSIAFKNFGDKKNSQISFGASLSEFMYNPIKNTMILDGVIAASRLKEARKKERFEVLFKELCQIVFVYGLAKPIQKAFELVADKFGAPIKLDPKTLFDKELAQKIASSKDSIKKLKDAPDIIKALSELDIKNPLVSLLENEGVIKLTKDKNAISFLKPIDEKDLKGALCNFEDMGKNISKLKTSKIFKTCAVIGNILITAGIMGILQPKITIALRKLMYGSNENPAIKEQEKQMAQK